MLKTITEITRMAYQIFIDTPGNRPLNMPNWPDLSGVEQNAWRKAIRKAVVEYEVGGGYQEE